MAQEQTDQTNIDETSSKFDFLREATPNIEVPNYMKTHYPTTKSIDNPAYPMRDQVTGLQPFGNNLPKNNTKNMDAVDAIISQTRKRAFSYEDQNVYAKTYSFDASPQGAHMARYKGYGEETYAKIGFNPELNNEAIFNEQTTMTDDFARMFTHSAWPMLKLGFMAPLESYGQMFTGDSSGDSIQAERYNELNALGYSTKGGLGGFTNNLLLSASYSAGIIGEAITEGMVMGAIEGTIVGPEGTAIGGALGGVGGALKGIFALPKALAQMGKYGSQMLLNLKNAQKYTVAKNLFKTASKTIGDFVNPISNTKDAFTNHVFGNSDNLSNMARAAKTFGGFYNDVRIINAALSEGGLEAGMVENNMYKNMYDKYYSENGVAPTSDEQRQMQVQSQIAAAHAKMYNTALIFYTNKITLPAIFKGSIFKNATSVAARSGSWKVIFDPKKQIYETVKVNFKNAFKGLTRPANYGKVSVAYFKTNVAEGLQENMQDVIADATEKYYTDAYNDKGKATTDYAMAALYNGLSKQWSAQGGETFLSGFAMGSVLRPLNNVPHWASIGYNKYFKNRSNWGEYQKERETGATDIRDAMNAMHQNGVDFLNLRSFNQGVAGSIARVIDSADTSTKEEKDAKHALISTAWITALQTGQMQTFLDNFNGYKQMSPKELEDAWGLEPGQGQKAHAKIDEITKKGENLSARYTYAMKMHPQKLKLSDYKKGTPEYEKADILIKAHQVGIRNLIYLQDSFDNNLERINKINNDFASLPGFANMPSTYIQAMLDPVRLNSELQMLRTEVEMKGPDVEQKRKILTAFENLAATQDFYTEFTNTLKEKFNKQDKTFDDEEMLNELVEFGKRFEELGVNPEEDYKTAFVNVLKAISGDASTFHKFTSAPESGGTIDNLFASVLDNASLKNESNGLVRYINTLLDPEGFTEHINRNFQWMSNLYANRKEYYKDIVNEQIKNIEHNSLLADLADEGIYVDLDEFADFVENGTLPTEFIDSVNERIITEDSPLWEDYIDKFYEALENRDKKAAGENSNLEEQLEERIKERNDQRAKELDDAKLIYQKELKIETGKTEQELIKLQNTADDKDEENKEKLQARLNEITDLAKQLESADAIEIKAIQERLVELGIISDDSDLLSEQANELIDADQKGVVAEITKLVEIHKQKGLPIETENGVLVDTEIQSRAIAKLIALKEINKQLPLLQEKIDKIVPVTTVNKIENTKAYKAYQKTITEINDRYDKLINELKAEFAKKATGSAKPKPSTDTSWDDLPVALKDRLTPLFEEFKTKNSITPEEEGAVRQNWLKTQSDVINEYNNQVTEGTISMTMPKLMFFPNEFEYDGVKKTLADLKLYQLKALKDSAQKQLNTNKKLDPADSEKTLPLTQEDKNNLTSDLKALTEYINSVRNTFRPDVVFESKLQMFKERILNRQDELEEELDDEGNVVARYLDGKIAQRVTKHAEKIQAQIINKPEWTFSSVKEETLPDGTVKTPWTLSYFRSILENEALTSEQKVEAFMSEFKKKTTKGQFAEPSKITDLEKALKTDFSEANLIRTINKLSFRESAIAGNTVDILIRDFFTLDAESGFKKITKPTNMTQEAFDSLFGDNGIITEFRDGMIDGKFFILSNNLNVFDSNLLETGLAGAMDIVAVDENGEYFIVDIKTSTESNWKNFNAEYLHKIKKGETLDDIAEKYKTTPDKLREINADSQTFEPGNTVFVSTDMNSKKLYFRLQQSIYRNLFYNMSGIMPQRLGLLPIELTYDLTGFITSAKKASIVAEGDSTVDLEYASEVEEYGVTLITPEFEETVEEVPVTPTGTAPAKVTYKVEKPEDTSLGANLGKTVLYKGHVGKLVINEDGTFGVEFPNSEIADLYANQKITEEGTTVFDLTSELLPAKDRNLLSTNVGISFINEVTEPMQTQIVDDVVFETKFLDKKGTRVEVNGVEYKANRNNTGQIVSLSYNNNDGKIKTIDKETQKLSLKINELLAIKGLVGEELIKNQKEIVQFKQSINALNARRKILVNSNQSRTIRGGNAENIIFALNSLPQTFSEGSENKTVVDEVRELKKMNNLASSSTASQRIDEILSINYPIKLDTLFTQGISGINGTDINTIVKWANDTIEALENYGYGLLAKGDITTDVENQILALNQLVNDIKQIKLKKDGQISKQQPAARKIFQPEKVQTRTNVPQIQKPTGTGTEGVPPVERREKPTKLEQKQIRLTIRQLIQNQENDDIANELLGISATKGKSKQTDKFIKKLNKAKSSDEMMMIWADAHAKHMQDPVSIEIDIFDKVYNQKLATFDTELSIDSLSIGDILILKTDYGKVYVIYSKTEDDFTVREFGEVDTMNLNEGALQLFKRLPKDNQPEIPEIMEEITSETKDAVTETGLTLDDLKKSPDAFDDAKANAKNKNKTSRLKDLKDNSKLC